MNKYLCALIGAMWLVIFAAGSWWVSRVESRLTIVDQLQFRALYLGGQIPAAPVATPAAPSSR